MHDLGTRRVAIDHPAIAGHFPNDPLVPGVLILEEVHEALVGALGIRQLLAIRWAKFLAPLRPGEEFRVTVKPLTDGRYDFACMRGEQVVAQGQLQLASSPP